MSAGASPVPQGAPYAVTARAARAPRRVTCGPRQVLWADSIFIYSSMAWNRPMAAGGRAPRPTRDPGKAGFSAS